MQQKLVAVGGPANYYNPFTVSLSSAGSLLLGGILGGMAPQASIQPIFAARDATTAKRAALLAALFIAPYGLMTAFLGLMARTGMFYDPKTIVDAKTILPRLLTTPEFIPPVLGGLALAGMLAAILSTMGPVNFAIDTIAAKDIYHAFIIGTAAILLCVLANRLHWSSVDKTYGAVGSALLVILLVKLYERLTGVEKADPSVLKY